MGLFSTDTPVQLRNFNLPSSPFAIDDISAGVDPQDTSKFLVTLKVTNNSQQILDAYSVGFEFFTVFNEYYGHQSGYSLGDIKPGKSTVVSWSFLMFEPGLTGTLIVYQFKSRLKSGLVWIADTSLIENKVTELFQKSINIGNEEEKRRR